MEGRLRASDTIARIGGDEFTILLPEISQEGDAITVARDLLGFFSEPFRIGGVRIDCTTSIGIAIYPARMGTMLRRSEKRGCGYVPGQGTGQEHICPFSGGTAGRGQGS